MTKELEAAQVVAAAAAASQQSAPAATRKNNRKDGGATAVAAAAKPVAEVSRHGCPKAIGRVEQQHPPLPPPSAGGDDNVGRNNRARRAGTIYGQGRWGVRARAGVEVCADYVSELYL